MTGRNITSCNSGKLSIVSFNQADDIWKDEIMVDTLTIGSHGCALTCMAMLLDAHGQSVTPKTLNDYLIEESGYNPEGAIYWDIAGDFGTSTIGNVQYSDFTYEGIKTKINNGDPVLMQVYMDDPDHSHFIIITGYEDGGDEPKDFYIIDPSGGNARRLSVFENDCNTGYNNLRIFSDVNATCINDNLPDHCFNCLWEPWLGETDEDCGGECPPCFKADYSSVIDNNSELGNEIVATGFVEIESQDEEVIDLSNTSAIKAGNEIVLKNNVFIPYGSDIILKSTKNSNELTRDCDEPCVFVPNYYNKSITPNLLVSVTNIEHIHYILVDRYGGYVNEADKSINFDGKITLFPLPPSGVYFSKSWYTSCVGEVIQVMNSVTVYEEECDNQIADFKKTNLTDKIKNKSIYHLYPNPTTGIVNIQFSDQQIGKVEINITNIFSKTSVLNFDKNHQPISIDLSNYPKGIYLLTIKTSNEIFVEKIVLQ